MSSIGWQDSSLQQYLNKDFYNTLTNEAKNQISSAKWYLSGQGDYSVRAESFYKSERSLNVFSEYSASWIGNIGVIYATDFGFASGNDCLSTLLSNYSENCSSNFLYNGETYFTITPANGGAICVRNGDVYLCNAGVPFSVFPSLYLKDNIETTTGDGTKDNPYELSLIN